MKKINKSKEYKFIRKFSSISIAKICRKLKINRTAIMNGTSSQDNFRIVKEEIEKEIARIYLGR